MLILLSVLCIFCYGFEFGLAEETVKKDLQRATKVIKDVDEAVSAGQGLWQKLEPLVAKLAGWLGVAVNIFWA